MVVEGLLRFDWQWLRFRSDFFLFSSYSHLHFCYRSFCFSLYNRSVLCFVPGLILMVRKMVLEVMGFLGSLFGILGFIIGSLIGLVIGFYLFIYSEPEDVQVIMSTTIPFFIHSCMLINPSIVSFCLWIFLEFVWVFIIRWKKKKKKLWGFCFQVKMILWVYWW